MSAWNKRTYHIRVSRGLCPACGKRPPSKGLGLKWCKTCRKESNNYNSSRYKRWVESQGRTLRVARPKLTKRGLQLWKQNLQKKWRKKLKEQILVAYGGECACCGEKIKEFLTIDHVHGGGTREQQARTGTLYKEILREGCPSRYQILCYNCNCGRYINGGLCPHKQLRGKDL